MARLSKTHHFKIFQDTGIPTPPGDENDPFDDTVRSARVSSTSSNHNAGYEDGADESAHDPASDADDDDDGDDEDETLSRDSLTSVSTFPGSTIHHNDHDFASPPVSPQKFFTPQIIRPSFRRPESVRRMQMSSPRQSILSHNHSPRSGTPRSEYARGSPRGRGRRFTEELALEEEAKKEDGKEHPLVLLHITFLPTAMPWSMESMQELLPAEVAENLMLLRSKVSETVVQRGILIPHPREEYEMLEERLLEALELKGERLTKCGHFRGRTSDSSGTSSNSDRDGDSGLGSSSSNSDDDEVCATCRHHVRCTAGKKQKWSVKVFAANGLMRSSAWAAAWDGMESVDVEILPWIGEEERRKLDRRREEEGWIEEERRREEESRGEEEIRGDLALAPQEGKREDEGGAFRRGDESTSTPNVATIATEPKEVQAVPELPLHAAPAHDLPPIYRVSQVPLSVLLRNYVYLLAQDRRNVAMFILSILAVFLAARSGSSRADPDVVPVGHLPLGTPSVIIENLAVPKVQTADGALPVLLGSGGGAVSDTGGGGDDDEDGRAGYQHDVQQEALQQGRDSSGLLEGAKEAISVMLGDDGEEAVFELDEQAAPMSSEDSETNSVPEPDLLDGETQ